MGIGVIDLGNEWGQALQHVVRILVGGYFVLNAVFKGRSLDTFWAQIMGYKLTGPTAARWLAAVLPPLEFVLGFMYAMGTNTGVAAVGLVVLLSVFSAAILIALVRRQQNDCGCGPGTGTVSPLHVVRNFLLGGLVLFGASTEMTTRPDRLVVGAAALIILGAVTFRNQKTLTQ